MSVTDLHAALTRALGKMREPRKTATADAGTYSYDYLTLDHLSDHVRQVLAAEGLSFTQPLRRDADGTLTVWVRIMHDSGATWLSEPYTVALPPNLDMRALGSAITYSRRYKLGAEFGLSGTVDDDAAGVVSSSAAPVPNGEPAGVPSPVGKRGTGAAQPKRAGSSKVPKGATPKQVSAIRSALRKQGFDSDESAHAAASGWVGREVTSMTMLTVTEASDYLDHLWNTRQAERVGTGPDGEPPEDPWANKPDGALT